MLARTPLASIATPQVACIRVRDARAHETLGRRQRWPCSLQPTGVARDSSLLLVKILERLSSTRRARRRPAAHAAPTELVCARSGCVFCSLQLRTLCISISRPQHQHQLRRKCSESSDLRSELCVFAQITDFDVVCDTESLVRCFLGNSCQLCLCRNKPYLLCTLGRHDHTSKRTQTRLTTSAGAQHLRRARHCGS